MLSLVVMLIVTPFELSVRPLSPHTPYNQTPGGSVYEGLVAER